MRESMTSNITSLADDIVGIANLSVRMDRTNLLAGIANQNVALEPEIF